MQKFFNFFYKLSTIIFTTIGLLILAIIAAILGVIISIGPDIAKGLTDWVKETLGSSNVQEITKITDQINDFFNGIHWSTKDLSTTGVVLLSIFSVNVGLIGFFFVFGLFSIGYRVKMKKYGKQGMKKGGKSSGPAAPSAPVSTSTSRKPAKAQAPYSYYSY